MNHANHGPNILLYTNPPGIVRNRVVRNGYVLRAGHVDTAYGVADCVVVDGVVCYSGIGRINQINSMHAVIVNHIILNNIMVSGVNTDTAADRVASILINLIIGNIIEIISLLLAKINYDKKTFYVICLSLSFPGRTGFMDVKRI